MHELQDERNQLLTTNLWLNLVKESLILEKKLFFFVFDKMTINTRQDYRKWWFGFPNMLNMVLHLKWLTNVFELWKLVHREAPEIHFFLTPGVGRLSVQLLQHNKLLCLILEAGKKCCSGSLVWVNLNNSNESDLHSQWWTWFCMLEKRSSQRLILI